MSDFPSTLHRSMYGKSDDPEHADNRHSREFLDGYAEGLTAERGIEAIGNEWRARGCPEELPAGFCEWKRGFNAGSMRRAWSFAKREDVRGALQSGGARSAPQGAPKLKRAKARRAA